MGILLLPGELFQISFAPVGIFVCSHNVRNRIKKQGKCTQHLFPSPWVHHLLSVLHPFSLLFNGKYFAAGITSYQVHTQCIVRPWSQKLSNGTGKIIQSKSFSFLLKPYILVMMKTCQMLRLHTASRWNQSKYSKTKHITSFPLLQSCWIFFSSYTKSF